MRGYQPKGEVTTPPPRSGSGVPAAPYPPSARIVREGRLPPYKDRDEFKDRCWNVFYAVVLIASGFVLGVVW